MKVVRVREADGQPGPWCIQGRDGYRMLEGTPFQGGAFTGRLLDPATTALAAPVEPSKIICVGRNYVAHAAELGNQVPASPLFFLKPPSAIIGPGETILLPRESRRVDFEGELALVIGRRCRRVSVRSAMSYVFGYTVANDVTARDIQRADVQFTRGKGFDTFCPVGPWIVDGVDPRKMSITTRVNGEVRQHAPLSDMIFNLAQLISEASRFMTLVPGDLILTGTPAGVGRLSPGDEVAVEVDGVGVLNNPVDKE